MNKEQAESDLGHLLTRLSAAWSAHDTQAYVSCFASDAFYVTVNGCAMQGRAAIEQHFINVHHKAPESAAHLILQAVKITFPKPEMAAAMLTLKALRVSGQEKCGVSLVLTQSPTCEWLIDHHHAAILPRGEAPLPGRARDWLRRLAI